jgi:hypothetical protein
MVSLRLHITISHRLKLKMIALVQVVVMVMLAVPASCYDKEPDHEKVSSSQSGKTIDDVQSNCPCCPDENKSDSDNDSCSTCSYCTYYAPSTPIIITKYDPFTAPLIAPEQFTKLTDVHIPIFVPPQNLA